MRRAVVDIGTTACRLVVAEAAGGGWPRVCHDREIALGLGRAVRRGGGFGEGLLQLTDETLRRLRTAAVQEGVEDVRVTLAERLFAAEGGPHLRDRAEAVLRAPVQVVSAADDLRGVVAAAQHRLALVAAPVVIELADDRLRVAVPGPGDTLRVVETATGLHDLVPDGGLELLHPAVFGRTRDQVRGLVAPFGGLAPGGGPVGWPVVTGAPATRLARAVSGRRATTARSSIDGARLPLATVADLEQDLLTAYDARELSGGVLSSIEDLALAVTTLRAVLEQLHGRGGVVTSVDVTEGRLWADVGSDDGPGAAGIDPGMVTPAAPVGRPRAVG